MAREAVLSAFGLERPPGERGGMVGQARSFINVVWNRTVGMVEFGVSVPTGREGLMVPTGFASRETIVDAGMLAEALGYHSVWGNDHITVQEYIQHLRPSPSFYDPLICMAALSSVTRRVKLAIGIFVFPWRTPCLVTCAKQLATLDVLSGGRLILGVGTGAYPEESAALNIADNAGRLNEGVEALRVLFEEERATYAGRYVRFRDVRMLPKPVQRPLPIYLGRHRTTAPVLRWIARHGQGWIPSLSPDQFAEALPRLEEALREQGRRLEEVDIVREISVSLDETMDAAMRRYLSTPAKAHMRSLSEGKLVDLEREAERSLIGTADDVVEGIQSYLDAGVRHFMFNFAVTEPRELTAAMERFAGEIMPSFL